MKNMDEVRQALTDVYNGLKNGDIKSNVACEMNNACGKILTTVKYELEYYSLLKETPKVQFLDAGRQLTQQPIGLEAPK